MVFGPSEEEMPVGRVGSDEDDRFTCAGKGVLTMEISGDKNKASKIGSQLKVETPSYN